MNAKNTNKPSETDWGRIDAMTNEMIDTSDIPPLSDEFFAKATWRIEPRIKNVQVTEETITAYLADGRVISVPLAWSWRLSEATPEQRNYFEIIGDGQGVHWPDIMRTSALKACCTVFRLIGLYKN